MTHGGETKNFEDLLRKRGVDPAGNAEVEAEIDRRYRGHRAVLVLDSSGFTRITQSHGIIHFLSLIIAMRDIIQPHFVGNGAIIHWAEADNLYAVFPTARQAIAAAVAAQKDVVARNRDRAEASRLAVCIGIGAGELLCIGEENIFGDEMNVASKLGEDVAEPNEILVTESAYKDAGELLAGLNPEQRTIKVSGVDLTYYAVDLGG